MNSLPLLPLQAFSSVRECLEYFEAHRLEELPQASHGEEESYHLPRVTPLDPIPEGWGQLPIDPEVVSALTDKEVEQQRAIWELIYTEFTHIQTLETIINVSALDQLGLTSASIYLCQCACMWARPKGSMSRDLSAIHYSIGSTWQL